jgi:hypothetical protein
MSQEYVPTLLHEWKTGHGFKWNVAAFEVVNLPDGETGLELVGGLIERRRPDRPSFSTENEAKKQVIDLMYQRIAIIRTQISDIRTEILNSETGENNAAG